MSHNDRIGQLEDLLAERQTAEMSDEVPESATGSPEVITTATFDPEGTTGTLEVKTGPPDIPLTARNRNGGRPKSLHGMTTGDIQLLAIDGGLTPVEQDWFNKRKGPEIDFSHYGKNAWMAW